ncbi:hypothetical protein [Spirosoma validum]|uniref:DUF4292 domain-containing protein n=1 Tax=Spirosoma validum TaxID=2771355 RepID=A0A927AXB3_9BACT|nr:hypothetical protein [Spirosoma validum]MBD2751470.1 hypothetical protein [Spirosoma validum]
MKTLALFLFFSAALMSCSPNIQVVTLRGSNVRPADEGLILDNDTLTLRYNFASERGVMHISLVNKLNRPLYVDWKRSSFIVGQDKLDYWYDVADVQLEGATVGSRYSRYSVGYLGGTISKEDMISFIPPQTKLDKQQFVLVPDGHLVLSGPFKTEQEQSNLISRKKPIAVSVYNYSADKSPLTFRNYLTLSTDKDFKNEFHIDTKFWASDVKVLPRDQVLSNFNGTYSEPVPFKKPDSFYVTLPVQ